MQELWLIPIAFITSAIAGVMGMGGGVLLIGLMPGLVPASAIVPLHAITQLASNVSRAIFGYRDIEWRILPPVLLGAMLGAAIGAGVYSRLDLRLLPALIGLFILVITWRPLPRPGGAGGLALVLLGFYQTGLGMLVGATGPLGAAVLSQHNRNRDWLVVNTAVYMTLNHALRALAFVVLGFSVVAWWPLLLGMIVAVVLGSWVGTRLRSRVPQMNFEKLFRLLVTCLALRMIAHSVLQFV